MNPGKDDYIDDVDRQVAKIDFGTFKVVNELRTYKAAPGKRDELVARFKKVTMGLFADHGIAVVGFWVSPTDPDLLVYLCAYENDAERRRAWSAFDADPRWSAARAESEREGPLVASIDAVILEPVTDIGIY